MFVQNRHSYHHLGSGIDNVTYLANRCPDV
jgi:hypothetical protein